MARPPVSDATVAKALAAFESLPPNSGRFARMRAALLAVSSRPAFERNGQAGSSATVTSGRTMTLRDGVIIGGGGAGGAPQHPDMKENH